MLRLHLLISGMVTGVGFRYFVAQNAKKLNLAGWVKEVKVLERKKIEKKREGFNQYFNNIYH